VNLSANQSAEREYMLHVFLRHFVLEHPMRSEADYDFWLATVLEHFSIFQQAKILYIIFGPVEHGGFWISFLFLPTHQTAQILIKLFLETRRVNWNTMCTRLPSQSIADDFYKKVGRALKLLHSYSIVNWSEDTVISLVEELTSRFRAVSLVFNR